MELDHLAHERLRTPGRTADAEQGSEQRDFCQALRSEGLPRQFLCSEGIGDRKQQMD